MKDSTGSSSRATSAMFPDGAFGRYLYKRGVLLKDAGKFFEGETEALIQHAKATAEQAGRPYRYLDSAHTHASGQSKEAMARAIAEQDGITFERSDHKIVWVSDFDATAKLAEQFKHMEWPTFLIRQVAAVNPCVFHGKLDTNSTANWTVIC
ncbi:MAG TPA: hypothetical protein PLR37_14815, partial [Candidatus Accumulibacter phosphatis]|nr:hypothetical protein [Candidatus Accumulibacter phosphatis]